MKIRTGFVSNSSSSSFVCIITENAFEEALSKMTEREQKFLRATIPVETFDKKKIRLIHELNDMSDYRVNNYLDEDDMNNFDEKEDECFVSETICKLQYLIPKDDIIMSDI